VRLHQAAAECQPQPGALLLPDVGPVELLELQEDPAHVAGCNTDTGVPDVHLDLPLARPPLCGPRAHAEAAPSR